MKSEEGFRTKRKNGYGTVLPGLLAILLFPGPAFSRILHHGFDALPLEDLKRSFGPTANVLRSDESGQGRPYYYVILTNPLFYGSMLDGFGFATRTWLDREEDGLNGNELRTTLFH